MANLQAEIQAPVLVTGAAGFIGFALARRLLEGGRAVVGIDSINDYYDPALKEARLAVLRQFNSFTFHKLDLADRGCTEAVFRDGDFGPVVHLAAQAGVRYSLQNPHAYLDANLSGFLNVLEGCRHRRTPHLVFASSSSVYGANTHLPFSVHDNVDHPISLYAATKKANELMAHAYSHLYSLPTTGLRFFTVYGPWGRPDMAMFIFAKAIAEGQPIRLFNHGRMRRDFTYVDDVIEAVERLITRVPAKSNAPPAGALDPASSTAPWRIYNIGNNRTVEISRVVELLEQELGQKAKIELVAMQPGDVAETCADVDDLMRDVGFRPSTPIELGVHNFIAWYRDFHRQ
ncbi:MAG TPA: NAD-dependent epimerase [Xanthobacteraceae bacterium]|nr:NAD-dependent epimerase [Xanthobacteraceae bacterium]